MTEKEIRKELKQRRGCREGNDREGLMRAKGRVRYGSKERRRKEGKVEV